MNSSGIKRGLATTAVAALAVTGIPALATSASAAPGDVIQVAYTGPARNAGSEGVEIVLETKGITEAEAANLVVVDDDLDGSANDANQTIGNLTVVDFREDDGDADPNDNTQDASERNEFGQGDGFDEIVIRVPVTTAAAGDTAKFAVYLEEATAGVQATEPRAQVSVQTSGPVASLEISPSSQTAPAGQASANYTLSLRDSAGRLTQLTAGEVVKLTAPDAQVNETDGEVRAGEAVRGTDTFTAQDGTPGAYIITADGPNNSQATATLQVVRSAGDFTDSDVDIVTQADGWNGFGGGNTYDLSSKNVPVRVDQNSIRIDIRSDAANNADAGAVVVLNLTGGGITFGGKSTTTVSTTLDANGVGSLTITPDSGSVQVGDTIDIDGNGFDMQLDFVRGALTEVNAGAETYVSKLDGSVDITVTATDQFGLPVAGAYVDARRAGQNNDAAPTAKKVTDANGQATFTFTDADAVNNSTDTVTFRVFEDQFAAAPVDSDTATIRYTNEGTGSDFVLNLDNINASGAAYSPSSVAVRPLSDANADTNTGATGDEVVVLDIVGGDTGAPATVTVDNGALLLRQNESRLSQGAGSESIVLPDAGAQSLRIIGTKSGLVTVTVTSGGRTKTAQFTVTAQTSQAAARNVAVSGPAEADAGDRVTFTAVVTDAFGNPIAGFPVNLLNVQVSGDGELQDSGATTDANGAIALNVRLDDDADDDVTVRVEGLNPGNNTNQFGAAANKVQPGDAANSGAGLGASSNVATATVEIADEPVVKELINLELSDSSLTKKRDRVTAEADDNAAGLLATLFKNGQRVKSHELNEAGDWTFSVKDTNGNKKARYKVVVAGTATTKRATAAVNIR